MNLSFFLSNPLINVSVISWLAAQLLKTLLDTIKHKSFDRHRLDGFNHPVFALAFVLALIVMYDATGVRWAAGLHARAINHIVEYLEASDDEASRKALHDLIPRLNESLGHRVREVICGAALGFGIAFVAHFLRTPS